MSTGDDPRVDDLRRRLRDLGYLDAGVDRFVLAPARAARRPSAIAWLASVRIGALAAVLLGPAAAVGLAARLPGLITGPRDTIVVAVYLGVLFGVGVAVSAAAASMVVLWVAKGAGSTLMRRGRALSLAAGIAIGLLCLIYLTLWWHALIAGLGRSAPLWSATALAIAAAICVLLAHAVMVTTSAVIVAAARGTLESRAVAPIPRWMVLAAGIVGFGGAVLLLTISDSRARATGQPPALTVVSGGLRVRVIAIDGFDPQIFDELSSAGRVPALTAAFSSARAQLAPPSSTNGGDPARAWTTVATGQVPEVHGVQGLETRRLAGVYGTVTAEPSGPGRVIRGATDLLRLTQPAIATGAERRAKTFWEVAASAGLRTVVVNWWATWPARPDAGIVLTDRATLRLERGGQLDAEVAPADVFTRLQGRWPALRAHAGAQAAQALSGSRAHGDVGSLVRRSAELDAMQLALLADVVTEVTDLSVVYLPGLDIAQHALLGAVRGGSDRASALAASTLAARLDALKEYYVALDRLLANVVTPAQGELVMLVTEPGRVSAPGSSLLTTRGEVVRAGTETTGRTTDVAPTILHALGLPIGRDLSGVPLVQMFSDPFVNRYPVRFVTTYGAPRAADVQRSAAPLDQEMIDRLRSLGYVR